VPDDLNAQRIPIEMNLDQLYQNRPIRKLSELLKPILTSRFLFGIHQVVNEMTLRGLGFFNYESLERSGEAWLLKFLLKDASHFVAIDVGANVGKYSRRITELCRSAKVYAFEPHPEAFATLNAEARMLGYVAYPIALTETRGTKTLHASQPGGRITSASSTLIPGALESEYEGVVRTFEVETDTIDQVMQRLQLSHVDLLKIDVEGSELSVLRGAKDALRTNRISIIQFEISPINLITRTFLQDFIDYLPNYRFFRLLPNGLVDLDSYKPWQREVFADQNIVAILRNCAIRFSSKSQFVRYG
jgi:FkbM family methyltransferase